MRPLLGSLFTLLLAKNCPSTGVAGNLTFLSILTAREWGSSVIAIHHDMGKIDNDFRATFGRMAAEAVITRAELAALLATTEGAVTQMAYKGELPQTAFPAKRRAVWFVADIRRWLAEMAARRGTERVEGEASIRRTGRPRLPIGQPGHTETGGL